jgi:hypothetical protein
VSATNYVQPTNVSNEAGITVDGSRSDQKFQLVSNFPVDSEVNTIMFNLLGETADNTPVETINVKTKVKCPTW